MKLRGGDIRRGRSRVFLLDVLFTVDKGRLHAPVRQYHTATGGVCPTNIGADFKEKRLEAIAQPTLPSGTPIGLPLIEDVCRDPSLPDVPLAAYKVAAAIRRARLPA